QGSERQLAVADLSIFAVERKRPLPAAVERALARADVELLAGAAQGCLAVARLAGLRLDVDGGHRPVAEEFLEPAGGVLQQASALAARLAGQLAGGALGLADQDAARGLDLAAVAGDDRCALDLVEQRGADAAEVALGLGEHAPVAVLAVDVVGVAG